MQCVSTIVWFSNTNKKRDDLEAILKKEDVQNAFVFLNRKRDIDGLTQWLKRKGYKASGLHGDMVQSRRTETLADFKDGKIDILVCSDVAARGLDIKGVSHVFNFDIPMNADDYVHRIGRTGRAGQNGRAWSIATDKDEKFLDAIHKRIKKTIPVEKLGKGGTSKPLQKVKDQKPSAQKSSKKPHKKSSSKPEAQNDDSDVMGFGDDIPSFFR